MARPLRIQYEGAFYHVACRGIEKRTIFGDDTDRRQFLEFLEESLETYQVILHCHVLMGNHFHLMVETPLANLSEFMRKFNIQYIYHFNTRYKRVGALYQGRYKSILVEKENYFNYLSRYIHTNPVRTKFFDNKSVQEKYSYLKKYQWSSFPGYINDDKTESYVSYDTILGEYGGSNDRGRRGYGDQIKKDLANKDFPEPELKGGMILGSDGFVDWVKKAFLSKKSDREIPGIRKIVKYRSVEVVSSVVSGVLDIKAEELKRSKGLDRQILMECLYRFGGLKGREIGEILGIDYSTVSVGRKRLRERMKKDKDLSQLFGQIEGKMEK